jgi:hypothetical protein
MDRCRCAGALDEPAASEVSLWADGAGRESRREYQSREVGISSENQALTRCVFGS